MTAFRPSSIRFAALFRLLVGLMALVLLAAGGRYTPLRPGDLAGVGLCGLLTWYALTSLRSREGTVLLWRLAPLLLALMIATGADDAGFGAWLACLLAARFGYRFRLLRHELRWLGAQMLLATVTTSLLTTRILQSLTPKVTQSSALLQHHFWSAVLLVGCLLFVQTLDRWLATGTMRTERSAGLPDGLTVAYLLPTLLGVVLLASLPVTSGLLFLPLCLLLLLAATHTFRLHRETTSLRHQIATAHAMGAASVADLDTNDANTLLQRFLTLADGLIRADHALIWILDETTGELTPTVGLPDLRRHALRSVLYGEGLVGHAAARMQPRLVPDAALDPHHVRQENLKGACLLYPIFVHDRLLGVASWTRSARQPFAPDDLVRLHSLVPQASIALENVRIRAAMHTLASTDGLTGLHNHQRTYDLLREEVRRAARYHRPLAVLMMDVDSFKTFNDTYGHRQGDQLLRAVAQILAACIRTNDYVGRYGGEEFLIILPETGKDDACRLAERIRAAVEQQAWVQIGEERVRRTLSIGVAAFPEDGLSGGELVQRADEALYRAKRAGKNCVLWA